MTESIAPETWKAAARALETQVARLEREASRWAEQRSQMVNEAGKQAHAAEDAQNAIPGYWFGQCADVTNPDDEGTKLLDPVIVLAEYEEHAVELVQDLASDAMPDCNWVDYPVRLRRATWAEITERLKAGTE